MEQTSPPARRNRFIQMLFSWANPTWEAVPGLTDESWRTQYEDVSKSIWKLVSVFVAACAFCVILLSAPDTNLFSADAKITIPVISLSVSYSEFLFFAPLFLIGFGIYIHVFLEQLLRLRLYKRQNLDAREPSATHLFNLNRPVANFVSSVLFYWLLPAVLAYFVWKTIPRPGAFWLLSFAFVLITGVMLVLAIRRFPAIGQQPLSTGDRVRLGVRWALLALCAVLFVPLLWTTGQIVYASVDRPPDELNNRLQQIHRRLPTFLFRIRRPELVGGNFAHQDHIGLYAPYADLRHADFTESNLEGADLSFPDLRRATLTGANFGGADLKSSVIDDFTPIDLKWKAVWCIVNGHLNDNDDCVRRNNLAWLDLSTANLRNSDFKANPKSKAVQKSKAAQSNGVDLRYADLAGANLTGVKFRLADLRNAILPRMNGIDLDGALLTGDPPPDTGEAVLYIQNRSSGACLNSPKNPVNQSLPALIYPCPTSADRFFQWWGKRLANGSVTLHVAGAGSDGRKGCLDGTSISDDRIEVQMWECDPDYENQYWTFRPVDDEYVMLEKNRTRFCLDGTGTRDGTPVPILGKCSTDNRDQHWRVTFEEEETEARAARTREAKRTGDLENVSRNYQVAPFSGGYESRSGEENARRARESRELYYRASRRP